MSGFFIYPWKANEKIGFEPIRIAVQKVFEPLFLKSSSSFGDNTNLNNNLYFQHKTTLGNVIENLIGLHETSECAPYGITCGNVKAQWCAYTISFALSKTCKTKGIKDETKNFSGVSQFIEWGTLNGRYKPVKTNQVAPSNMEQNRKKRMTEIAAQVPKMEEGDLIIWKGPYCAKTDEGKVKQFYASHIGMIEKVEKDPKTGEKIVWVIEGNANEAKTDDQYERYINKKDSVIGGQKAGEIVEINKDDGVIRKKYTIADLAKYGYSGFIDMKGISD